MRSKLALGALMLVALAGFSLLPAIASASPVVTYPTGTKMAINSRFLTHGVGSTTFNTGFETITCTTFEMTGTLLTNSGTEMEFNVETAAMQGTGTMGDCVGSKSGSVRITTNPGTNGLPWCIWSWKGTQKEDEATLSGGKCTPGSVRPVRFVLDYTGGPECPYERSGGSAAIFKTHPEDAVMTITEAEFARVGGNFLCQSSVKLSTSFTIEKDEVGTNPIYIS